MAPLLQIKNLSIDFMAGPASVPAVKDINIQIAPGETLALVGESGSGKSVSALAVLGLLPRSARIRSGEILFSPPGAETTDLLHATKKHLQLTRGGRMAMIFQEPMNSLNPVISCGRQVMEAMRRHGMAGSGDLRKETIRIFERVRLPRPGKVMASFPHQLSGGQKQRVMIAMAISNKPSLLICDEPTTALDTTVQRSILDLLAELQEEEKMGILFISHDLGVVSSIADRVVVMRKGMILEEGNIEEVFRKPKHPYTQGLLSCRPLLHAPGVRLPVMEDFLPEERRERVALHAEADIGKAKYEMAVADTGKLEKAAGAEPEVLIRVENLNVWYPLQKNLLGRPTEYLKAVRDLSFSVYRGETLGLVGESGCGKTTLGRSLLRLVRPHSGRIIYKGQDLLAYPPGKLNRFRRRLQIVFQDPYSALNPAKAIGPAIAEPLMVHGVAPTAAERRSRVNWILEKVRLEGSHFNRYPHEFSGGQRQRVVIARALVLEPSFVVFDESVSALDVSVQAQVLNLINDLKKEFGFTAVFISHDLSVVKWLCDRIMVMKQGSIEEIGPAEQVYHQPRSAYTRKLIDAIPRAFPGDKAKDQSPSSSDLRGK